MAVRDSGAVSLESVRERPRLRLGYEPGNDDPRRSKLGWRHPEGFARLTFAPLLEAERPRGVVPLPEDATRMLALTRETRALEAHAGGRR